jgi:hypothetical protein
MDEKDNVNLLGNTNKCITVDIPTEKVKGRKHFGDQGINWRIILNRF